MSKKDQRYKTELNLQVGRLGVPRATTNMKGPGVGTYSLTTIGERQRQCPSHTSRGLVDLGQINE